MTPEETCFSFEVPRELIAQEPSPRRADARLMLVDRRQQSIDHYHVRDLPDLLHADDRLVLNDTRVVPARLVGQRTLTGGRWQGLFLGAEENGRWRILQKTRGRIQPGETVKLHDLDGRACLTLTLTERGEDGEWWARPAAGADATQTLDQIGRVPLPPYIRGGNMVDADRERYQTVFARHPGAVAAPTAGLHFTPALLRSIERRSVAFSAVTLHVGADTFRPIATSTLEEHRMHSEWAEISQRTAADIAATRDGGGRIIAVGTTAVRVLETAALATEQEPAHNGANATEGSAFDPDSVAGGDSQVDSTTRGSSPIAAWSGETSLFIRPPYAFRVVDALLTNFHFPRTTLLVLVCTFGGRELIARAYEEAVREQYRFFSYGDAMLIV